jgi:predicted ATP-binding protein involved in virulence
MTKIQEMHEKCLDFLLTNYPNLPVELIQPNQSENLKAGCWFAYSNSNKNQLLISFWHPNDKSHVEVFPNIHLTFNLNKNKKVICLLVLQALKNSEMVHFFQKIAPSLMLNSEKSLLNQSGNLLDVWWKAYPISDYLKVLDDFIKYEKPIIDSFIKVAQVESLFPHTTLENYQSALNSIDKYRRKKSVPMIAPKRGIQLKTLKLENIGHYETINLDLSHQVTCLIGENGSGKSTILRSLALGLTGIAPFEKDATQLSIQRLLRLENALETKITYFAEGNIKVTYDLNGLKNENEVVFKFDKDSPHHAIEDEAYHVMHQTFNLSGEKANLLKYLVVGFSQQTHVSIDEKNRINGINYVENPNIEDIRTLIFNKPDNRFDDVSRWFQKAVDVETPFSERKRLRAVIEKLTHIINQLTHNDFRLLPILEGEARVASRDFPQGMPLSMLSQGYYNMMGWVGFFMKRLWEATPNDHKEMFFNTPAICLIDEIDTYLHPKWQAGLLDILAKSFPKTQFVVTTHSPYIVTHLENTNNTVKVYQVTTTGVTEVFTAGRDLATVSAEYFGVQRRPMFYQKLIDEVFADFDHYENENYNGSLDKLQQKIIHLERLLGKTDPDVETANRLFDTLKMLTTA